MDPSFWATLLTQGNFLIAAVIAEGFVIIFLGRFIVKLVDKIIDISTKTAEVLEKVSTDYRTKDK